MPGQRPIKTFYLIDGHAHFFRAYHAIRSGMTSPVTSEPTNLSYGFTGMLIKLLRDYRPEYIAVVIDKSGDRESFRSEIYPEYKANRDAPPEDFHPQVKRCLEVLDAAGIPVFAEEGVEADDVIAAIIQQLRAKHGDDIRIRIVSKDKDLTQLVDGNVELFDVYADVAVTPSMVFKTEGVRPDQVVDILALMGDSIDNVPGVPGIGPKTAAKLIAEYGSIENLYAHIDEIKGKRRENLEASRDAVFVSRELVKLRTDVDAGFDFESCAFDPTEINASRVRALFRQLGFNRHEDELIALAGEQSDDEETSGDDVSADGFADSLFESPAPVHEYTSPQGTYTAVTTRAELDALVTRIRSVDSFAFDTETTSTHPRSAKLCGISISTETEAACYIPVRSPDPTRHLDEDVVLNVLGPVFEDASIAKVGHNLKFDLNVLRTCGVKLAGKLFDTMIASYVLDTLRSSHGLQALALAHLDHQCITFRDIAGKGWRQRRFDQIPLDQAVDYAAEDADIALRLANVLRPELEGDPKLLDLYTRAELPLVPILAELEWNGIRVDPDELDHQRERLLTRIDTLRNEIISIAPHEFNPDSPKQLAAILFHKPEDDPPGLGIRPLKRGKTGPSTDVEVLERLAANDDVESPLPGMIVEYRQLTKLVNTYLVALKDAIDESTHRVHASFHQAGVATGRLSSSDPNLQNIPIRSDVGREIRRAFMAGPGNLLITADYSQVELRILAHLSEDPALIEAFERGDDIHRTVAAEVYGVALEEVTPAQRGSAKMVNFGIVYGITPHGLARRLGPGVSIAEAREIITNYKARFTGINRFLHACVEQAETQGYVETMLGRRRAVPQIESRDYQRRALGERVAINTVVQGSAADLIKLAMISLHTRLPQTSPKTKMLLQIHDELVFECPAGDADVAVAFIVKAMEHAMELRVPIRVDAAVSERWIDAK